ncbi:putative phage tail protein [Desulforamulus aquiferis]|nr:putative phage tail protein [Desulforamulus aquiferis]
MIVKVTIDGQDIYLEEQPNGTWEKLATAPTYGGVYPITITLLADNGSVTVIGSDDPELGKLLQLIVQGKSIAGQRMLEYLPRFLQDVREIQTILESEGHEIDRLRDNIQLVINDAYIMSASETRIQQWEQRLKITSVGNLNQRKAFLLATLRGQGKLNESKIKTVVNAFTDGDAIVTFQNSVLDIKILPPDNGDVYLFPDVERALRPRVPAHLGLSVRRWYSTWNDIKLNFADWSIVASYGTWQNVKNYIPPQ